MGLDHLRDVNVDDKLGLGAELDAAIERHVATYSDEWADTLADPERLARFVHFVNAPEVPDPSIRRVHERGQQRPLLPLEVVR
jgi:nitrite reductase (NADH) large subunit